MPNRLVPTSQRNTLSLSWPPSYSWKLPAPFSGESNLAECFESPISVLVCVSVFAAACEVYMGVRAWERPRQTTLGWVREKKSVFACRFEYYENRREIIHIHHVLLVRLGLCCFFSGLCLSASATATIHTSSSRLASLPRSAAPVRSVRRRELPPDNKKVCIALSHSLIVISKIFLLFIIIKTDCDFPECVIKWSIDKRVKTIFSLFV